MSSRASAGAVIAGKYKLLERLGGGGMGEVFRAEHQFAGRLVALKLLRPDFAQDEDLTRRFFQEAQAVNRIRHPNIVDVLDAGFCEAGPYVVMECLEGASLAAALSRSSAGRLELTAVLAVVLPMLDALEAAHQQGIVHRDLKPENVFLARGQHGEIRIKLLDFGIAKVLGSGSSPVTHTGVIFGTPDYLSPEQASGEGVVDGRSDIFAVGIVLFELLTGRRPFEAPNTVATAYKIVHAPAPTLASMGLALPPLVQEVLDVALAKDPNERFGNAASFVDMIAPVVADGATRREALTRLVDAVPGAPATQPPRVVDHAKQTPPAPTEVVEPAPELLAASDEPAPARRSPPPVAPTLMSKGEPWSPPPARTTLPLKPATPRPTPTPNVQVRPAMTAPATPVPPSSRTTSRTAVRTAGASRAGWSPRPLPASLRGRCHTRGSLPRAVSRWIVRAFGDTGYGEVLALLPQDVAESFRTDGFNALVWYDLDATDMFLEASTALLFGGDVSVWRELARENFDRDLGALFRPSNRLHDPAALLQRAATAWTRLYDFGTMRLAPVTGAAGAHRLVVRVDGFDAASVALRNTTLGTSEGLLRSGGVVDFTMRVVAGDTSFARDFEYEVSWG